MENCLFGFMLRKFHCRCNKGIVMDNTVVNYVRSELKKRRVFMGEV